MRINNTSLLINLTDLSVKYIASNYFQVFMGHLDFSWGPRVDKISSIFFLFIKKVVDANPSDPTC